MHGPTQRLTFVELLEDVDKKYGILFEPKARIPSNATAIGIRMSMLFGGQWVKRHGLVWKKKQVKGMLLGDWGYDVTDAEKCSKVFDAEDDEE